jgi:uncharacterized ferritin-like protein (DUF455 family)
MEIREWATRILTADTLEEKLLSPDVLTDFEPGPPLIFDEPTRPASMAFKKHSREEKLPSFQLHGSADNRAICLHRFAGHELLAVEIMAHALTAFPNAPKAFRKGLAHTLKEEQGHVKLYIKRMNELGLNFGDLPLYKFFWHHVPHLTSPIRYVSVMSLTFEMANLDFAPMYGKSFSNFGDTSSAALMAQILKDEIKHVSFGFAWLQKFKGQLDTWDAWTQSQGPLLTPKRATGLVLMEDNRRAAGIPEDWITRLRNP